MTLPSTAHDARPVVTPPSRPRSACAAPGCRSASGRCGAAWTSTSRPASSSRCSGPNGSGKTSLVRVLLGLQPLSARRGADRRAGAAAGQPAHRLHPAAEGARPGPAAARARPRRARPGRAPAGASGCAGAGRAGPGWTRRWPRSAARATRTRRSGGSPAASSSGCGWPRRWSATRPCCCATSRCSRSTWPTSATRHRS